jgi:2-hydroxymuconate-semialdehyde hydrolase
VADSDTNPEIGRSVRAAGFVTNLHDVGEGAPVLMVHVSGPGVSAWANWRLVIPELWRERRVIAPDMAGFGFTERRPDARYGMDLWLGQLAALVDALGLEKFDLIGNSFGGGLSLAYAIRYPERVRRLVLMGSVGVTFPLTEGLDAIWGYQASVENMRRIMGYFAFDESLLSNDLAALRYRASILPGAQEAFSSMFPAPRQSGIDALASPEDAIGSLPHETLIIHGRDDKVIPLETSLRLHHLIPRSQLHVFGRCGHWTQIEHSKRFIRLVSDFLQEADSSDLEKSNFAELNQQTAIATV